ncbi:MAG: hypothetical protein WD187_04085 [Candidatus Woykebacteria bacterium]
MSKKFVPILILTLITLVLWAVFQVYRIFTTDTIPAPTQKQIQSLDPNLDTKVLDDLETTTK